MAQIAAPSSWHFENRGQGAAALLHGLEASSFSWGHSLAPEPPRPPAPPKA